MLTKFKFFLIFLFLLLITNQALAETNLTELAKRIQPAVVVIGAFDSNKNLLKHGSGFFINEYGHLITNYHVLRGAHKARVRCYDGREFEIKSIIAEDKEHDLIQALVDLKDEEFVDFVEVTGVKPDIAEHILVVGTPMRLDLEQTVSEGIISGFRFFPDLGELYQITAPISPGSSGGPVVNMQGQVIGVVTGQFREGQNLNFAVPGEYVFRLKDKVKAKAFWQWAEKEVGDKRIEDLGQQLSGDQQRVAQQLNALREQIEIKKRQLYNQNGQLNKQKEREKKSLELRGKQLNYEYEALMRENNQLERMRGNLDPREFNSRLYDLKLKWNNYERKRKAYQDKIDYYNGSLSNAQSSRGNSALQAEIDRLESLYSEIKGNFNAQVDEYNSLLNDKRTYSAAGNQEHNGKAIAEIHLNSGRIIKVISWWEEGNMVMYSKFGGTIGIHKLKIAVIKPLKSALVK